MIEANMLRWLFKSSSGKPPLPTDSELSKLEDLARLNWIPKTIPSDNGIIGSKFSGQPFLAELEHWPTCPNCNNPLQLFLQLNSINLPTQFGKPWGDGILQLFYCTSTEPLCEVDCEAFFENSKSTLLRIMDASQMPQTNPQVPFANAFPAKAIIDWVGSKDYPNWEERSELGRELSEVEEELFSEKGFPLAGDKLGGWPNWVQGVEYPDCPTCGEKMRLLFQIDSECNIPYMFGDAGCGHITFCQHHPNQLAFRWACG